MVRIKYGKKKLEFRVAVEKLSTSLKETLKTSLQLQIPVNKIQIGLEDGDQIITDEPSILKKLRSNSVLTVSVIPFRIGVYHCSGIELGSGSFSQVYRGTHTQTQQPIAIKVIDLRTLVSEKAKEYHEREKKIMSSISHANIVGLYEIVEQQEPEGKYVYFVEELCAGGSLDSHIHSKPLSEPQARRILGQIADALRYLEQKKIVHRDLKPQNILLTSPNIEEANVKLCDFGFSRYYEVQTESLEDLESNNVNILIQSFPNTPLYAPPELLNHKPYDNKCDLWSVGAILYEMIAGEPLFKVKTFAELEKAHTDIANYIRLPPNLKISDECMDLLKSLLQRDSARRISWQSFFNHPFLTGKNQRALIHIYSIPNGEEYRVEITQETDVVSLKRAIVEYSKIPEKQLVILLEGGKPLNNHTFSSGAPWYLYDSHQAGNIESSVILGKDKRYGETVYEPVPLKFSATNNQTLSGSAESPAIKKLLSYQNQFENLVQQQKAFCDACDEAYNRHKHTLQSLAIQTKGLKTVTESLKFSLSGLDSDVNFLERAFETRRARTREFLGAFREAFKKMASIPLHKSLASPSLQVLADCFDRDKVEQDIATFEKLNGELESWFDGYRNLKTTVSNKEGQLISMVDIGQSYQALTRAKEQCRHVEISLPGFTQGFIRASQEVKAARRSQSAGAPMIDASECLEEMLRNCKEQMERTDQFYREINAGMIHCMRSKDVTQQQIQAVFVLNAVATDYRGAIQNYQVKFVEHQTLEHDLRQMLKLPESYGNYLTEMTRRRAFQEKLQQRATTMRDLFRKVEEEETARLKIFKMETESFLPSQLFPGVSIEEQPPVEIRIPPVTAPPIYSNIIGRENSRDLLASDFDAIFVDEKDVSEVKRENFKLRAELAEVLEETQKNRPTDLIQEIVQLRQRLSSSSLDRDQFFEEYEQRFAMYQQKLKEAEDKLRKKDDELKEAQEQLDLKDSSDLDKSAEDTKRDEENSKIIKELKEQLETEKNKRIADAMKHQADLAIQQHESASSTSMRSAMETVVRDKVKLEKLLKDEAEKLRSAKEQLDLKEKALLSLTEQLQETKRLAERGPTTPITPPIGPKTRSKAKVKEEKLTASTTADQIECPLCSKYFSAREIVNHADKCAG
eukprot:TRINITY_DN3839_c0_g1_i2.p1 TRINITY_DN3839_c0_g1~~TRINITY_DN3839_c0_g1_i2.p1  ORF type:complete len:1141 (+),score=357.35 TRINITY_DN3839_c0_g1_i2:191-3613(+)